MLLHSVALCGQLRCSASGPRENWVCGEGEQIPEKLRDLRSSGIAGHNIASACGMGSVRRCLAPIPAFVAPRCRPDRRKRHRVWTGRHRADGHRSPQRRDVPDGW